MHVCSAPLPPPCQPAGMTVLQPVATHIDEKRSARRQGYVSIPLALFFQGCQISVYLNSLFLYVYLTVLAFEQQS